MIKPPSLQKEYTLIFSGDPALDLPTDKDAKATALRVARETGRWDALIRGGEKPTVFQVRPLSGSEWDWLVGETARRNLIGAESTALALRLALVSIENFGEHKVRRARVDGVQLAGMDTIDAIYDVGRDAGDPEIGRHIVTELGEVVVTRYSEGIPPKP